MNQDHVAIHEDLTCRWGFLAPVRATNCEEQVDEISEIVQNLFEAFGDYIIPYQVECNIQVYPSGTPIPKKVGDTDSRIEASNITLSAEDGLSIDELLETLRSSETGTNFVGRVTFEEVAVNIRLESGDVYVNGDGPSIEYIKGEKARANPPISPISIEISYFPNHTQEEVGSESMYYIKIATQTDIWFEETDIGRENAKRLSDFLSRVGSNLQVNTVNRDVNRDLPLSEIY